MLIFVDGLGVGEENPDTNPMARAKGKCLGVFSGKGEAALVFQGVARPLDACLGLRGLPQSATGQTAFLTGVNAARALGYHLFGFPNAELQGIIMEHSLLKRVKERGKKAAFLNAFRPRFFEMGEDVWKDVPLSVTTWANRAAGLPFFSIEDVARGRAIYQEFTNESLRRRGFDVPLFTPEKAGRILAGRSRDFDLLLFEYFRTDAAGHSMDMDIAVTEVKRLDRFLHAFLGSVDLARTLVVLTSDHGNIEDLSVRGHTRNMALTNLWGLRAADIASTMHSILDVTPTLLGFLDGHSKP